MKEITGDLFDITDADAICVTTNGIVKPNGELVMGKGIALAFKEKWPTLTKVLGNMVREGGNNVHMVKPMKSLTVKRDYMPYIFSFPTKHDWRDMSDINLIIQSCHQLVAWVDQRRKLGDIWTKIVMTRPGCGNGGLDWERVVKPAIKDILDDRFYIISTPPKKGIYGFSGEHRFLSNFWTCHCSAWNLAFTCVEAAYCAAKCDNEEDRKLFVGLNGNEAKKLGRTIKLRSDWDEKKLMIMEFFLNQKFKPGSDLAKQLIMTHPLFLEETNTWGDTYWGVCNGVGENNLGKLLMKIREQLLS